MTFVDTNIIIRLMTNDVPKLRQKAEETLELYVSGELFIMDIVFTELFFVLEHNPLYKLERNDVCNRLEQVLITPQFAHTLEAGAALKLARKYPKLDFSDCLLAAYAKHKNHLFSFDKDLLSALA